MKYVMMVAVLFFTSCQWTKDKAKSTVNKAGEVAAKTGAEFASGVAKGVEKTFENRIQLSEAIKQSGIQIGKVLIAGSEGATDNVLSVYMIFDKDINKEIAIKISGEDGLEYGRLKQSVKGAKGEAHFVDFVFEKRTHISGRSKVEME